MGTPWAPFSRSRAPLDSIWVAFWPPWLPGPIPEPHLVDLFDDFGHPLGSKWELKSCSKTKAMTSSTHSRSVVPPRGGWGGRHGGMRTHLWRCGKTTHSEKNLSKPIGKRYFRKVALTGAVRKGELLRGKVPQGRPHPSSIALRSEGQSLGKKKT